jgi:lysozyme
MNISQEGISLIKKFEGCELEAYKCAAGVWTIGYGHTKDVKEGDSILKEDAESMLMHELQEYCNDVDIAVKVDLNKMNLMLWFLGHIT